MFIGIDLGGMSAKAACLNRGKIFGKTCVKTSKDHTLEETISSLSNLALTSCKSADIDFSLIDAVGLGAPGIVDSERGVVVSWSNFGWKDVSLAELLSQKLKKPVFLVNDANAAALGEAKFGAGKQYRNSVLITLGTGVGGGILIDGKLFEGYKSAGAEIGHTVIQQGGRQCSCGRKGCLETYVSTRALIEQTKEEIRHNPNGILASVASKTEVDGRTLFLALEKGDQGAERIFSEYIAALGEGILNFVNLFRPQAILIGGGVSAQGENLLSPLRKYVYDRLMVSLDYAPLEILAATLGNDAGIYGAAEFARTKLKKRMR